MKQTNAPGLMPLPLSLNLPNGNQMPVHAALLWGTDHLVLVDTGVPGQLDVIREGLLPWRRMYRVDQGTAEGNRCGEISIAVPASRLNIAYRRKSTQPI